MSLPRGVSLHATEEDKIRHEAGHVILHWLIGNTPISVQYIDNGLITHLEQKRNLTEQPWQHIMSLLAGPVAEGNDEVLSELRCAYEYILNCNNQFFVEGSDSFRIYDHLAKINRLILAAGEAATRDILDECRDLQEDFIVRFKKNNGLTQTEIQNMFIHWDNVKKWTEEEKKELLKRKFEEKRGLTPY